MEKVILIIIGFGMYAASYFPEFHAPAIVGLFGLAMIAGYGDRQYSKSSDRNNSTGVGWLLALVVTLITMIYFASAVPVAPLQGILIVISFWIAFFTGYSFVEKMTSTLLRLVRWYIHKMEKIEQKLMNEIH